MTLPSQEPLLPQLWHRIKDFFSTSPTKPDVSEARCAWRKRYLERCLLYDTSIEATRKQLERSWEAVST